MKTHEELTIDDIEMALVAVKRICFDHVCYDCPFNVNERDKCRLAGHSPLQWKVGDWERK